MLNNINNFFNLFRTKRIKKTLAPNDLLPIGVRDTTNRSDYQPAGILYKDLEAQIGGVTLTTTGTSGAATLVTGTLNIPQYQGQLTISPTGTGGASTLVANTLTIPIYQTQIPHLEWNNTDKTVWNNGQGNIATNTSYGYEALKNNTTGTNNTAIGGKTLSSLLAGSNNTAVGLNALTLNTADNNTAIGSLSLYVNTVGTNNTAVGVAALTANTTGSSNIALGGGSLGSNTIGGGNIAIGQGALSSNITGSDNTAFGNGTGSGNFNGSVILGSNASATANNQFVVGSNFVPAGTIATETITPDRTWLVRINGANYKIPLLLIP